MVTVLIVEDNKQVRVFAESYLRRQGHRTLSAETPEQALALLDRGDGVDVLFSEIALHRDGLAGVRLARQAARGRPDIKVIYAGEHALAVRLKPLLFETSAVLEKPYTVEQLRNGVARQIARGS
jgi:CheY-like chemotaxis protein